MSYTLEKTEFSVHTCIHENLQALMVELAASNWEIVCFTYLPKPEALLCVFKRPFYHPQIVV